MRPFNDYNEGRSWLKDYLKRKGFENLRETERYCRWDLEGEYGGKKWCFELKNRSFFSDRFGDVAVNKDKYDYLVSRPEMMVLVEFFLDRWCMIDLKKRIPDVVIDRECPRTTRFEDRTPRTNRMMTWYTKNLVMLQYD